MSRVIKAPRVKMERPMAIMDREKALYYLEDEIAALRSQAQAEAEELLQRAQADAEQILSQAEAEKQEILNQANAEAETIRQEAAQQGQAQGNSAGRQEVRKEVAGMMGQLAQMIAEARSVLEDMILSQELEIRRLVAQIATKVVQRIVHEDEATVARVARECIRRATDRQSLTLLIHPDDREIIEGYCEEYRVAFDDLDRIELREDARVPRGGVIVETGSGGVDGRIERQLSIIGETLVPEDKGVSEETASEEMMSVQEPPATADTPAATEQEPGPSPQQAIPEESQMQEEPVQDQEQPDVEHESPPPESLGPAEEPSQSLDRETPAQQDEAATEEEPVSEDFEQQPSADEQFSPESEEPSAEYERMMQSLEPPEEDSPPAPEEEAGEEEQPIASEDEMPGQRDEYPEMETTDPSSEEEQYEEEQWEEPEGGMDLPLGFDEMSDEEKEMYLAIQRMTASSSSDESGEADADTEGSSEEPRESP